MHRLFAAVRTKPAPARPSSKVAFTRTRARHGWSRHAASSASRIAVEVRAARSSDAHDLFRFYAATTTARGAAREQLSVQDFDIGRRGGAYDPPHLIGGNPLAMRRHTALIDGDERHTRAFAFAFEGRDRHPHVVKVRTRDGDSGPRARPAARGP
jgi:hypothetical protein